MQDTPKVMEMLSTVSHHTQRDIKTSQADTTPIPRVCSIQLPVTIRTLKALVVLQAVQEHTLVVRIVMPLPQMLLPMDKA